MSTLLYTGFHRLQSQQLHNLNYVNFKNMHDEVSASSLTQSSKSVVTGAVMIMEGPGI